MVGLVAKEIVRNLILVFLLVLVMFLAWDQSRAATVDLTLPPGDYMLIPVQPYTLVTIQSTPVDPPVLDTDGDGVTDDLDQCPDTPLGDEVDATGCTVVPPPVDSDGDGIADDVDACPTEPGVEPDGCPLPPPTDSDGDGVPDDTDMCPDTDAGVPVDPTGCPVDPSADADLDGVPDAVDLCDDTPPGDTVEAHGCTAWPEQTVVYLDKTFAECVAELEASGGGFCEMPVDIAQITLPRESLQFEQRGGGFPSILKSFNGAAVDGDVMCFHGGGHANYGGTDSYCWHLTDGYIERVIDSPPFSKYVHRVKNGVDEYALRGDPDVSPESTHTYDGLIADPQHPGLIILSTGFGFTEYFQEMNPPPPVVPNGIGLYDLNPTDQQIADVPPRSWKWRSTWDEDAGYPSTAYRDGWYYFGTKGNRTVVKAIRQPDMSWSFVDIPTLSNKLPGGNTPVMDTFPDGNIWRLTRNSLSYITPTDDKVVLYDDKDNPPLWTGYSLAPYGSGSIHWDGKHKVSTFEPGVGWSICLWGPDYPGNAEIVYSKWAAVPGYPGYYFGWSNPNEGHPIVYRHNPAACDVMPQASVPDLQTEIETADTLTIPEGATYWNGAKISGTKTVDMRRASILQHSGKGFLEVQGGPHVIRNLRLTHSGTAGIWAYPVTEKLADGRRVTTVPLDLVVDGFEIANQGNGILTASSIDAGGEYVGTLTMRNGTIRDGLLAVERYGKEHLLYCGKMSECVIQNVTLACHREGGHLYKSRAVVNRIVDSVLDQEDCDSSRLVDIPCGGYTEIRNTTLIQSPIANRDMVGYGTEKCRTHNSEHRLVLENTTWVARNPKAYFADPHVDLVIECRGTNTFTGIPSPCPSA